MSSSELNNFINSWNRIHKQTSRILKAAPADQLEWQPKEGMFTMGELITHIPRAELLLVRTALAGSTQKPELDLSNRAPEEVVEIFDAQHAQLVEEVSKLEAEQLSEQVEFYGRTMPRIALLWGMTEHEIHHRAQVMTYYRLVGIEPPKLFG